MDFFLYLFYPIYFIILGIVPTLVFLPLMFYLYDIRVKDQPAYKGLIIMMIFGAVIHFSGMIDALQQWWNPVQF